MKDRVTFEDESEELLVMVDGEEVFATDYDSVGSVGMDAVRKAVQAVVGKLAGRGPKPVNRRLQKRLYLIRDKNTGKYSPGGNSALELWSAGRWNDNGKAWTGTGAVKNHLRQFVPTDWKNGQRIEVNNIPDDWEVVTIEVSHAESNVRPARTMIPEQKNVTREMFA